MIPTEQETGTNEGMRPTEHQVPEITGLYKTECPLVDPQNVFNTPVSKCPKSTSE